MKVQYFKTQEWGDCYVANENYKNIIAISESKFHLMEDKGNFEGPYKNIQVSENNFKELKEYSMNRDRGKGTNLLNKIHLENFKALKDNPLYAKNIQVLTTEKKVFSDNCTPHTITEKLGVSPNTCVKPAWANLFNSRAPIIG